MFDSKMSQLFAYHAYATRLVLDTAAGLSDEELDRKVSPSHGTVRRLLLHMLESDAWFLATCKGEEFSALPQLESPGAMRAYWHSVAEGLQSLAAAQTAESLARRLAVRFGDHPFEYSVWELLMQTFQHAAHHRGELSGAMTTLGHPLPTLDILLFYTDQSGQPWPFRR